MQNVKPIALAAVLVALATSPAQARELPTLTRLDTATVELNRAEIGGVVWISADPHLDDGDRRLPLAADRKVRLPITAGDRRYVILVGDGGHQTVVAERVLPLQQGSNFRDLGGYPTRDGRTVKWGKAFRSGAMPLLTGSDYGLLDQLHIGTVVDLRSLEERAIAPDLLDDRTGALFVANDYSLKPLMAQFGQGGGENTYRGIERILKPQFRSLFRRLVAEDGAVLYHCSAGQDRTGIATALLYDVLGVDRETILKDYHLSTTLRRPQWEMPAIDPKDHPDNLVVQYYFARPPEKRNTPDPLFTRSGASHLAQFFVYLDDQYGGSEGYLRKELGFDDAGLAKLRATMLD